MARGNFSSVPDSWNDGVSGAGKFLRIGLVAFNKHIADEMTRRLAGPRTLLEGSPEQQRIWDVLINQNQHVVVEAVAGSGKTTTLMQYCYRLGNRASVDAMTYHSLGFKAVKAAVKHSIRVDQYKVLGILDGMSLPVDKKKEKVAKYRVSSMVSFAKTYGHGPNVTQDELERIADRHDVDLNGLAEVVFDYVPKVLGVCARELHTVDFDDMVWLPMQLRLTVPKYDVLCVDEYQDTALTQQWLAVQGGVRVVAVGDVRQSIYSFRGCGGKGFDNLRAELPDVVTLPLTLTRRCPKSHVRLAQTIVPQIHALDHAPEGVVRVTASLDAAVDEMRPGDLVVCRVNAELIGTAYKLLKRGVKAVVRGRDIGQGMVRLIEAGERRAGSMNGVCKLTEVLHEAGEITQEAVSKFNAMPQGRGEMRAANAQDRYECLVELSQECGTVQELRNVIERLFSDFEADGQPKHAVVLGTVHRTKGLESSRVYILRPDLIPHPMGMKRDEDRQAEMNLAYVAVTRAKFEGVEPGELVFVGRECSLFPLQETEVKVPQEAPQEVPEWAE